jgi:hypothetical protein
LFNIQISLITYVPCIVYVGRHQRRTHCFAPNPELAQSFLATTLIDSGFP